MILIELNPSQVEMLIKCKRTKKREFERLDINQLFFESIYEFYLKYGNED